MLIDATDETVESFWDASQPASTQPVSDELSIIQRTGLPEHLAAALTVLVVATVALFLVSLVAAASFVVVAQRRLRQ